MTSPPFRTFLNRWSRKLHRCGAILVVLPLGVVICTGILLQVKKQSSWVQPPTQRGLGGDLRLTFDEILSIARNVPEAAIDSWDDVDRLDVRPDKGVVKVRGNNRWEVQIDTVSGEVLQTAYRRSDLIESIHDGSWFAGDTAKLLVFLPSGIVTLMLWVTGIYLWLLPHIARRRARLRASAARARM